VLEHFNFSLFEHLKAIKPSELPISSRHVYALLNPIAIKASTKTSPHNELLMGARTASVP